MSLTIIR